MNETLRRGAFGPLCQMMEQAVHLPGKCGWALMIFGYRIFQKIFGFN
ncbi:MAG: hypothetical protein II888_00750 [Clostridia bacterium]|nr:hypothetical protein [Clostridia bacterium]